MAKHTPGPWEWYWRTSNPEAPISDCGVYAGSARAVSVCRAPRYEKREQWEANARLIAAAPELLHAAQEMVAWATNPRWTPDSNITTETLENLEAAIAKAEGE